MPRSLAALALLLSAAACRTGAPTMAPLVQSPPSSIGARDAEPAAPAPLRVVFVDVGQGDAILLDVGDVELLIDAGPKGKFDHLAEVLDAHVDGPLEVLVVTHPHDDHFGGAAKVLDAFDVARVITNGERRGPERKGDKESKEWNALEDAVADEGRTIEGLAVGDVVEPATGLRIEVLATGNPAGGEFKDTSSGEDINNDSLVLLVTFGGRRLLLTGDIEVDADQMLVERFCEAGAGECPSLHADVLKVAHHGSADFDEAFLEAVAPAFAVVSAGFENKRHCLPRVDAIDALLAVGATIYSTSSEGTEDVVLTIAADGTMSWNTPDVPVFAWRKEKGGECEPVSY